MSRPRRSPAAAAAWLSAFLGVHSGVALPAQLANSDSSLAGCLYNAGLSPVTMAMSDYGSDSAAYNQRLQPEPTAILYPSSHDEIASALSCASQTGAKVSARGGGHSYASYSLDGDLVIDLGNYRNITVDGNGVASIGAGNRLGDIYLALDEQGWAVAAGVCEAVGIGGHAGFGGFGLPSRMWGLLSDQVIGYDVVLANGTAYTHLTRSSDPDLFWALNGAAPNFGIVTTYRVQAHHEPANAVTYSYYYDSPSSSEATDALLAFADFGNLSAPANLGMVATTGTNSFEISGVWYGPKIEFGSVIQRLKDDLPGGYTETVERMSWIDSAKHLAGTDDLSTHGKMLVSRDSFYAKSLMTPSTIPLERTVVQNFFEYLFTSNSSSKWFVETDLYGGRNSYINSVHLNESAFGFRDKHLTFQLYASSPTYGNPYPAYGIPFVQGMYDTLVDGMTKYGWTNDSSSPDGYAAYVNYVDPELSFDEVKNLYWGSQYDRLSSLKAVYDPTELLNSPQGIRPA
ncbi:hypothetical protein BMF94_5297 [Rhodotorula taiwanensis]|uniref:FAD-binding PCMH-type domain-containing protein n=1 Tax=Rhodotorula taiwanensis TaxID=741276 RepID=A0A2S5B4P4_9BASI|nr:hypothetical protein BMF94_5297 [Rhodotorula taiwanensis]